MTGILVGCWVMTFALAAMSVSFEQHVLTSTGLAVLLNLIPTWIVLQGRTDALARAAFGILIGLLPTLLFYALKGTLWQTEMLLVLALGMIALIPLCDARPIVICCGLFVVKHIAFVAIAPDWITFESAGLSLSMARVTTIILGGALLCLLSKLLLDAIEGNRLLGDKIGEMDDAIRSKDAMIAKAEENIEEHKAAIIQAERDFAEVRRTEQREIAAAYDDTIQRVMQSVAKITQLLQNSAQQIHSNASSTGEEARAFVNSAETANRAANTVAAGIAELSMSIAEVADNAGQQSQLSQDATESSGGGGIAISKLTDQSKTIGEATRSIVRIAERTNLLALNAAIEAASAGASGRGFSIVAHEVKLLASQASDAATRIEAFLGGVRSGTLEAEENFRAIDLAIGELGKNASSIRYDIENQRQSADTIENFARTAARDSEKMVQKSRALADRALEAKSLSDELDQAASDLTENAEALKRSSEEFHSRLNHA